MILVMFVVKMLYIALNVKSFTILCISEDLIMTSLINTKKISAIIVLYDRQAKQLNK